MMPETVYYETNIIAKSLDRLEMVKERMSMVSPLTEIARIEQLKFDRTGLLVTDKVLVDYLAEDEDEEE